MIIKIDQTASNIKQSFDINGETIAFQGELGRFQRYQSITLCNKNTTLTGKFEFSRFANYIPFRFLFKKPNQIRRFLISKNGEAFGSIVKSVEGFFKTRFIITLNSGDKFYCYSVSRGRFNYIAIYEKDIQVALIETFLSATEFKFNRKLYILEKYNAFTEAFILFALYDANFYSTRRFHMSGGSVYGVSYTLSFYNNKFDPSWREINFPNENFFGKTNLFKD